MSLSLRNCFIVIGIASIGGAIGFGCSSSSSPASSDDGGVGTPEGGKKDSGIGAADDGSADAALNCNPVNPATGGFQPKWHPPSGHKDACSQTNIDNFLKFCFGAGDQTACQSFLAGAEGKTCAQCILTPATAAAPGPLVDHPGQGFASLNFAGCLAIAQQDDKCAQSFNALQQCDDAACAACVVPNDPNNPNSLDPLNQCQNQAESTVCQTYGTAAQCAQDAAEAGRAGECLNFSTFEEGYAKIVPVFCLKTGDGGTGDASDAANEAQADAPNDG
jgi:hypothetical protein